MSIYPGGIDSFPTREVDVVVEPPFFNDPQSSIVAIEETLGINPQGSEADVADRIAAIEGGSYIKSGQLIYPAQITVPAGGLTDVGFSNIGTHDIGDKITLTFTFVVFGPSIAVGSYFVMGYRFTGEAWHTWDPGQIISTPAVGNKVCHVVKFGPLTITHATELQTRYSVGGSGSTFYLQFPQARVEVV